MSTGGAGCAAAAAEVHTNTASEATPRPRVRTVPRISNLRVLLNGLRSIVKAQCCWGPTILLPHAGTNGRRPAHFRAPYRGASRISLLPLRGRPMKVRIERFGLLGLAASCLTVW